MNKIRNLGMVGLLTSLMVLFLISSAFACGIDIKPFSDPNAINLNNRGVVPVAIWGGEGFNVCWIDQSTIIFAGAAPIRCNFEDVNSDGYLDLICHFNTQDLSQLNPDSTRATLSYRTYPHHLQKGVPLDWGDRYVEEWDSVKIVGKYNDPVQDTTSQGSDSPSNSANAASSKPDKPSKKQ